VHRHAGLLRAGIASSGNEHRLGANEAPPAIISVFMGRTLTQVIEAIASGKTADSAEQAMIKLGVAKLPDIEKDNTDRNRTSPFAFTGNKFEFRAVGSSASIAFPVCLLNVAVAESLGELTDALRAELKKTKKVDDAVLKVVRPVFRATKNIRFEGNNYSDAWVKEAEKRGLPNLRRTPEALAQLMTPKSRKLLTGLGVFSKEELDSRFHVRLERYVKDILIEAHTTREMVDTMVLPAGYAYSGALARAAADAKTAGIANAPQAQAAGEVGKLVTAVQKARAALSKAIDKAESMHDALEEQAKFCTTTVAQSMHAVRDASDALELAVGDQQWPLPKYREMLFPA
jgi:glutamine synthetase